MKLEKFGEVRARVVGGTDREGGGDGPVVVLMHGFGAPGDDLVALWRVLEVPREMRFVFPEAPLSLAESGAMFVGGDARAWWKVDMLGLERALMNRDFEQMAVRIPVGLDEAREKACAMLDAIESALGVGGTKIVLGGFSQGAMLSTDIALRTERKLGGLVLMSGTIIAEKEWLPRLAARRGLHVFQSHGREDPLLPFELAQRLGDEMRGAGLEVTFVPFRGGHEIPPSVLTGLGRYLSTTCESS